MSRTGRHRGGALRARRGVRGDVRGLPANPPRGSQSARLHSTPRGLSTSESIHGDGTFSFINNLDPNSKQSVSVGVALRSYRARRVRCLRPTRVP
eukprot:1491777-Prymnesium_polylepis.1